jgi:hypothetical protein
MEVLESKDSLYLNNFPNIRKVNAQARKVKDPLFNPIMRCQDFHEPACRQDIFQQYRCFLFK